MSFGLEIKGRIIAVDPGDRRIGLAVSDEAQILAKPLNIIPHQSRLIDAATIAAISRDHNAVLIVVGCPTDSEGNIGPAGRKSMRLVETIRSQTEIPVILWDESYSTVDSMELSRTGRKSRKNVAVDDVAAAVILRSYLDSLTTGHRNEQ